jgi:hypothetical protein
MTTDPSWLYSTIAQSSAAIVAIIGGFITAAVLRLTSEKRSLFNQKSEKVTRLAILNNIRDTMARGNKSFTKSDGYRIEDLIKEIATLGGDIASLDARLSTFSYPPYLGGGVTILSYLAAVGILLPIFVIGYELYNITLKNLTITLFSIGIILIFGYIISLIRILRRKT